MNKHPLRVLLTAAMTALPLAAALAGDTAVVVDADDPALEWGPCPPFFHADCRIAVAHGDPAAVNSDILFKYPAGEAFPNHWHTSAERMVLLAGSMDVSYAGQDTVRLEVGDYAFGPPEHHHEGACVSDEACVLFIAFESPVDAHLVEGE